MRRTMLAPMVAVLVGAAGAPSAAAETTAREACREGRTVLANDRFTVKRVRPNLYACPREGRGRLVARGGGLFVSGHRPLALEGSILVYGRIDRWKGDDTWWIGVVDLGRWRMCSYLLADGEPPRSAVVTEDASVAVLGDWGIVRVHDGVGEREHHSADDGSLRLAERTVTWTEGGLPASDVLEAGPPCVHPLLPRY